MNRFRRLSLTRLSALLAAALVALGAGAAVAMAALGSDGPKPPAKPLAQALNDGLNAPEVAGVSARIAFTNNLIDSSGLSGANPMLTGAKGRFWASADGKVRLELQSSSGQDAQLFMDDKTAWVYDSGSNTAYVMKLKPHVDEEGKDQKGPITLAQIESKLAEVAKDANLSGAIPSNVGGEPAYTVKISPKRAAGLFGGAQIAWDAARGIPLRGAIYAKGRKNPVLEITATEISFGSVSQSVFDVTYPQDAKVVTIDQPSKDKNAGSQDKSVTGLEAVQSKLDFKLVAPATIGGLARSEVRLVGADGKPGAIVTYGDDLNGIIVMQTPVGAKNPIAAKSDKGDREGGFALPSVSINGASGQELATALGTVLTFERDGVSYTVIGSMLPAAAEAAARDLR
ncbi:MAG: hypothetical protein NTV40_04000 [Solirubrobacterales bacterium]|nr:hypothetical protein [Solirubrobacterales bacterium]